MSTCADKPKKGDANIRLSMGNPESIGNASSVSCLPSSAGGHPMKRHANTAQIRKTSNQPPSRRPL